MQIRSAFVALRAYFVRADVSGVLSMNAAATGHDAALLKIEIVDGLHKGATLSLNLGDYIVGSAPGADIVIRDSGVDAEHAVLRVDQRAVFIEAVGDDVTVAGRVIRKGHGCRVRMPDTIAIGGARLALESLGEVGTVPEFLRPIISRPLLVAVGVVACALVFTVASRGLPTVTAKQNPAHTGAINQPQVTDAMVEEAVGKLKARLKEAGLTTVTVAAVDKRVVVAGAVGKQDEATVTSAQRWFDETFGGRIVMTANLKVSDSLPAFRVQAIWYGERPYVVLEDGRHVFEGATMDNGWRVQRIADDRIVVDKGGQSLALTYK